MTQDTRKDRRVKIVSLNVRYKSATVDEFIENHAHDVSRGGIYIKTGSPFPPGTLLKFEIRLASDQALITGVGRVVWKRDSVSGTGDRPAGMGVKFIKIDDPSKAVIDKLVNTRADAGRAYESESETGDAPPAAAAGRTPSPPPAAPPPPGNRAIGKSTMLGIGAVSSAAARPVSVRPTASTPPRPNASSASAGGMFPKSNSEADMPPKQEQTVMKQAAELLEEALREAGGSMEDVGNNPLFAGAPAPPVVPPAPAAGEPAAPVSKAPISGEGPVTAAEAARARAMVAEMQPAPRRLPTDPPRTSREVPAAKGGDERRVSAPPSRPSARPSARPLSSAPPKPPKKSGGSGLIIGIGVVAAAVFVGVFYRDALFGSPAPAAPAVTPTVQAAATAPPTAVAPPAPSAAEAPSAVASAAPSASAPPAAASAAPTASAARTAAAPPPPAYHPPHPAAPHPPAAPTAPKEPVAAATATAAPESTTAPAATAASTATSEPAAAATTAAPAATAATAAPTATATAAPASTATSAPTAKPTKPAKPSDDNPY